MQLAGDDVVNGTCCVPNPEGSSLWTAGYFKLRSQTLMYDEVCQADQINPLAGQLDPALKIA